MECFDVGALYTNVEIDGAVVPLLPPLREHRSFIDTCGLTICEVDVVLRVRFSSNIFRFDGQHYQRIRGLTVVNRLAPLLANAYTDSTERQYISCDTNDLRKILKFSAADQSWDLGKSPV
ncbi:hypothetical protein Tcan_05098 [Toxocara canis]|uniref:Uncharacterized protein n=1 Tax=Toxocara canis TaxID=6265 RepID=A0A0B2UMW9_TOXCA|nr:hypothetical protein Tcan_05098 [Toxocara canis]